MIANQYIKNFTLPRPRAGFVALALAALIALALHGAALADFSYTVKSSNTARVRVQVGFTSNDPDAKAGVITMKLSDGKWKLFEGELIKLEFLK